MTKKRLKKKRMREKTKRKEANKRDPRRLRPMGDKSRFRFATPEERLKYKIEKAKIKEALLVEKLKSYEVPKAQGPMTRPDSLTGEERFYLKKMAQKQSNYVPVGIRGIFGGVVLNMHLHWKKHETVKVICKPCKPGQIHEYAREIARLSGGTPIQVIGNDTIVFYRGRNYVQPEVMSPVDTLSKKKALERSKYEQSLETVRHFIAICEKELELYYQHIALYDRPCSRSTDYSSFMQKKSSESMSEIFRNGKDGSQAESNLGSSSAFAIFPDIKDKERDASSVNNDFGTDISDSEIDFSDSECEYASGYESKSDTEAH